MCMPIMQIRRTTQSLACPYPVSRQFLASLSIKTAIEFRCSSSSFIRLVFVWLEAHVRETSAEIHCPAVLSYRERTRYEQLD